MGKHKNPVVTPGVSDPRVHLSLSWELEELGTSCGVEKIPLWVTLALNKDQSLGLMESLLSRTCSFSKTPFFSEMAPTAFCTLWLEM